MNTRSMTHKDYTLCSIKTSASIIYYIFAKLWTILVKIAEPSLQSMCILIQP